MSFIIILSFVLLGTTAISAADWEGYVDVSEDNAHYEGIKALTEQNVFKGYESNEFKPWENISRQHAAVILSLSEDLPEPKDIEETLKIYKDVDSNHRYAREIAMLTEANIFRGDEDGYFSPTANITRQQMASVLVLSMNLSSYDNGEDVEVNLDDVTESHQDRVQILANLGLTNQLEDFRPAENITRGAVATLIHKAQSAGHFDLSIMHMNDSHGHVEPLPHMLTAIKEVREENPEALLFHAGDVFSGTLYFTEYRGQVDMELFNLMDMTAMTFGNHEFDLGLKEEGNKSLAEFVEAANFPFLGSNIYFSEDPFMKDVSSTDSLVKDAEGGQSYFSIIEEVNGEEIGIFGLNTEETIEIARPNAVTFSNYIDTAKKAVQEFEEAGIDKVIAVTHLGLDNNPAFGNDQLLAQVDGIDVIVGGHSHTAIHEPVVVTKDSEGNEKQPTLIVQAGDKGRYLGTLDVEFDENGVVVGHAGELLETSNYEADPEASEALEKYAEVIKEIENEEIGAEALIDIKNSGTGEGEAPIGNLVTDAMLAKAQEKVPETVIAFQNGGGIRATIEKGPITVGEVMDVLPFGNDPVTGVLTGEEIKETLEHSVHLAPDYHGGFLHVSGMTFKYDSGKEQGDRIIEMKVNVDGEFVDLDLDEEYTITTNEFTAGGGDGFDTLKKINEEGGFSDIGEIDWEQLRDYLIELEEVKPEVEGRIIDVAND